MRRRPRDRPSLVTAAKASPFSPAVAAGRRLDFRRSARDGRPQEQTRRGDGRSGRRAGWCASRRAGSRAYGGAPRTTRPMRGGVSDATPTVTRSVNNRKRCPGRQARRRLEPHGRERPDTASSWSCAPCGAIDASSRNSRFHAPAKSFTLPTSAWIASGCHRRVLAPLRRPIKIKIKEVTSPKRTAQPAALMTHGARRDGGRQ